jgi:hypothetical protein
MLRAVPVPKSSRGSTDTFEFYPVDMANRNEAGGWILLALTVPERRRAAGHFSAPLSSPPT